MDKNQDDEEQPNRKSDVESDAEAEEQRVSEAYTDEEDDGRRKSSYGFDEYQFESPLLDESEDHEKKAEESAKEEAEKFMKMSRLKTTEYSKLDMVKMATSIGGLNLDESLVDPVSIPISPEERASAVREIYGPDMTAESEPYKDPTQELEVTDSAMPEKIRSPPNLYEALQSNFLKSNYKSPLYRLFLLGTHDEHMGNLIDWTKEIVEVINIQSYNELITGVLCVYEYFYIHVLEGSEDNLVKFMQKLADDLEPSGYEWDLKFNTKSGKYVARDHCKFHSVQSWVLGIFRIQQRQLTAWRGEKVFPNKMHDPDVPEGGFREKYFHFLRQCLVMAFTYNRMAPGRFNPTPDSNEEFNAQLKKTLERAKIQRFKSLAKVVTPITFIQYVLDNKDNPKLKIRSLREHLEYFGGTPPYISSSNTEWPPPGRIAPYD
ncbi:unnamed protein product [Orchesella dallaii]|uniref:Uncharacterized protein n=1 Tax=Orchesella dallaii TaxID=48710 RepID=A0ABP1PYP1_9HEXA